MSEDKPFFRTEPAEIGNSDDKLQWGVSKWSDAKIASERNVSINDGVIELSPPQPSITSAPSVGLPAEIYHTETVDIGSFTISHSYLDPANDIIVVYELIASSDDSVLKSTSQTLPISTGTGEVTAPATSIGLPDVGSDKSAYVQISISHASTVYSTYSSNSFTIADDPLPGGYAHRWKFNEGSGDPIDSVTGTQSTANSISWRSGAGKGDSHINFTKSGDSVINTGVAPTTGSTDRTVALWFNPDNTSKTDKLFSHGTKSDGEKWVLRTDKGNLRIEIEGDKYVSNLSLSEGSWNAIACVLDGGSIGDHTLYLNGATERSNGNTGLSTTSAQAKIGEDRQGENTNGQIDDVIFWDKALSVSELDAWYNKTTSNY
jgi:hypothetical protein